MENLKHLAIGVGAIAFGAIALAGAASAQDGPTCSDELGYDVHGQHIINDYLVGPEATVDWPPNDASIGDYLAGTGPAVVGAPGPGFHFPNGVSPGASFCTDSQSPGFHFPQE